ncbi:helix-turn-helix domain-containing protein [Alteromonas halophila]|uniref:Helix-turn-helix domain-containing protein n=1 Tax=Alteromonas halophila TaxID=516698 RepID=A0A918JC55_9ALTE|nr:helix-turn-helix domain-containing protein [Alteromonas halophila]GGW74119.1 hypothetical protein GCM10007391_02380 [Alteromonas halophila]
MTGKRQQHVWLAMLRALLGVRRDKQLAEAQDELALTYLRKQDESTPDNTYRYFIELLQKTPLDIAGQLLNHYLDVSRMGNLMVAMVSSDNIGASLTLLRQYPDYFYPPGAQMTHADHAGQITVRWQASGNPLDDGCYAYILLALFRYQAGQRFDFIQAQLPAAACSLLRPLCATTRVSSGQCEVSVAKTWLNVPSFYANPALLNAIEKSLMPGSSDSAQARVIALIDASRQPARLRLPGVAQHLGLSEAVLRKQLKAEGIAFNQLLKGAIHDLATRHLLAGNRAQAVSELLGFSDRRAFDRSYKEYTGINPGQLRLLGSRLRFQRGNQQLDDVVTSMPPLPKTVQSLLSLDDKTMRLQDVVTIIERDPIFQAHILARASRAIYGKIPSSLEEALSRNLGLTNIKHFAVLFAAQQQLSAQSLFPDIEQLIDGMLLSERLATKLRTDSQQALLLFGLLSLLLLFHKECVYSERVLRLWHESRHFAEFRQRIRDEVGICLYGTSSLMLLKWGMPGAVNRQLWALCDNQPGTTIAGQPAPISVPVLHDIAMSSIMPTFDHTTPAAPYQDAFDDTQQEVITSVLTAQPYG